MGLDSVELLMEVEKFFNIRIPDNEAENITTVQLMVDSVSFHRNIKNESFELRDFVYTKITGVLTDMNLLDRKLELSELILPLISPSNKVQWALFEEKLALNIPRPAINSDSIIGKIKSKLNWTPLYEPEQVTVEQFIAAICSKNCSILIIPSHIKSRYQIYIAVMSIIVDKIGVDEYEIAPEKSFTDDLGVD